MDIVAEISRNGFWFLVLLTPLVFVHELGHFLVARLCGVRVEVFSIGFGRELFGFTDRHGTRWKFSLLPLGGYVRMFGQAPNELEGGEKPAEMSADDRAVSFMHKSVGRRAAIVAAGPAANFIFAILVLGILYISYGKTYRAPVIDEVVAGSAAATAGILPGDRVVEANGQSIATFEDVAQIIMMNLDQPLVLVIDRNGSEVTVTATPQIITDKDILGKEMRTARLGIISKRPGPVITLGPIEALSDAVVDTYDMTGNMLTGIWQMISGVRPASEIGGVLRIATVSGAVAEFGFVSLVLLAVTLSINLGLINLFPVPMLDGGHLAFYAVEAVRGRPLSEGAQEWGLKIGLAMVLSLMLFATWNDLVYLKVVDYFRWLFT
ncbi:RIP metalloprotease RseP [Dongia mobilis]|uniref:RIP metalloprotease RseP n=1 Tax=Dongia sp. TaxID=1977262 RepID=UPI0026E97903